MQTQDPRPANPSPNSGDAAPVRDPKARDPKARDHHQSMGETVDKALHAEDEPMERSAPAAPFALVGLAYLAILAIAALAISAVVWWL